MTQQQKELSKKLVQLPRCRNLEMEVRGRNLAEGTPVFFSMESKQIYDSMLEPLSSIVQAIRSALKQSPPELSAEFLKEVLCFQGGRSA
ncbi:MAG: hypothetical protein CM1200mP12_22770 [Gammaproteobacteria bacterium]|nr:MAG: hypothetical protein CM1200mP12_22770 [Gammaproteobacteria bacterium]